MWRPAEKNVGRRLHHPLPLDHPPSLRPLVGELLRESLEDGVLRLLDLQEERLVVAAEEQPDHTDRADGSDAHRFESDICQPVAVEQYGSVGRQRFAVERKAASKVDLAASQRLRTDVEDLRRLVGDPGFAGGDEVRKVVVPVETAGLSVSDQRRKTAAQARTLDLRKLMFEIDLAVPDFARRKLPKSEHMLAIISHCARSEAARLLARHVGGLGRDGDASRQTLDVDGEIDAWQRLIEIVDVEEDVVFG